MTQAFEVIVRAHQWTITYWLDAEDERQAREFAYHYWRDDYPGVPDGMIEEIEVTT